jgi:hypothetical protein
MAYMPIGPNTKAFAVPVQFATDAAVSEVTPTAQASTNAYADVAGSTLDTQLFGSVSYTLVNAAQTITWKVLGANASDFSDAVIVQAAADVLAAASANYSAAPAVWRYYKVQIIDKVGGTHGTVTVRGIAKA